MKTYVLTVLHILDINFEINQNENNKNNRCVSYVFAIGYP